MGGTGKTTVARMIGEIAYRHFSRVPAVLSRGYRSPNKRPVLPVSHNGELMISPEKSGDEALLLAQWLPWSSVIIGKRRAVTGLWAVDNYAPDYVLLDDGHQYWRLERDLNILTISAVDGFGNGLPFPRGVLREPLWGIKRANLVILYQYSEASTEDLQRLKNSIEEENPQAKVAGVDLVCDRLRKIRANVLRAGQNFMDPVDSKSGLLTVEIEDLKVLAFCGLGSPASFEATLKGNKAVVCKTISFPDHHRYRKKDIKRIVKEAEKSGVKAIVTTEKDEVNLQDKCVITMINESPIPFYVLPVRGVFVDDGEETVLAILKDVL